MDQRTESGPTTPDTVYRAGVAAAQQLLDRADEARDRVRAWRATGDHAAAGEVERDCAALHRMATQELRTALELEASLLLGTHDILSWGYVVRRHPDPSPGTQGALVAQLLRLYISAHVSLGARHVGPESNAVLWRAAVAAALRGDHGGAVELLSGIPAHSDTSPEASRALSILGDLCRALGWQQYCPVAHDVTLDGSLVVPTPEGE